MGCRAQARAAGPRGQREGSRTMTLAERVAVRLDARLDVRLDEDLDEQGWARIADLLAPAECEALIALRTSEHLFRSRVVMSRHGFGRGEYQYFAYPLPEPIAALRELVYPRLVPIANRWNAAMGLAPRYPSEHAEFVARCHAAGQRRPTPLLLEYGEGDYNRLHQDLYGEHVFPLQVAILLSEPERDFTGGEFVLTEQRPRMQSKASVVPLRQGDAVIFAVHQRPVRGTRGVFRVNHRHGVSPLRSGRRRTLGVIFHDAT
ncbi:2OG-Fe(II) oxygenase [Nannocystaceae bacterium ST9]